MLKPAWYDLHSSEARQPNETGMIETLNRAACPLCGTNNHRRPALAYSKSPWELKDCPQCGMVYLENPPVPEALEEQLAWEKTFAAETGERKSRSPVLYAAGRAPKAALQRITRRNKLLELVLGSFAAGPILDIGCAGGHTLASLPESFIPFGIEISAELSRIAAESFEPRGGKVIHADALGGLAAFPGEFFTGIIMTSFLEHDAKARETLQAAKRVLAPDARVIIKVPNYACWNRHVRGAKWCGFRFPDHVNYFTPATLVRLLQETGYRPARFGLLDRLPSSDTMWLVARSK